MEAMILKQKNLLEILQWNFPCSIKINKKGVGVGGPTEARFQKYNFPILQCIVYR